MHASNTASEMHTEICGDSANLLITKLQLAAIATRL